MKRKLICLIAVAAVILSLAVFASENPYISLLATKSEQTVEVTVSISENSKICGCSFNLVYDNNVLELLNYENGDTVKNTSFLVNKEYAENMVRIAWASVNELEAGGEILTLTFNIIDAEVKSVLFNVEKLKMVDINGSKIECSCNDITVAFSETSGDYEDGDTDNDTESGKGQGNITVVPSKPLPSAPSTSDKTSDKDAVSEKDPEVLLLGFDDVNETDWFFDSVRFVKEQGIMQGVSGNEFSPNSLMTRAMVVTIVYRLCGSTECYVSDFDDVPDDAWYSESVAYAAENGIVNGVGDGLFAPEQNVTREQIAVILYNYSQKLGKAEETSADLSVYVDNDKLSSWAKDAMEWAVGEGVIAGKTGNMLDPAGYATRAEVAALFYRCIEKGII